MLEDDETLSCPKCGSPRQPDGLECPYCGVVYSRFDPARQSGPAQAPETDAAVWDEPQALEDELPWDDPPDDPYADEWNAQEAGADGRPEAAARPPEPPEPPPPPLTLHDRVLARLEDLHIVILGALILIHFSAAALFSTHIISADDDVARAIQHYRAATGKPVPQRLESAANVSFVGHTLALLYGEEERILVAVYTEEALAGNRDTEAVHEDAHKLLQQVGSELGLELQVTKKAGGWIRGHKVTVEQLEPVAPVQADVAGYLVTARTPKGRPSCILIAGSAEPAFDLAKEVFGRD